MAATQDDVGGETFQIATSRETTVGEMTEQLVETLALYGVTDVDVVNAETRVGDVMRNFSDTSKAKARLGWQPQTDLKSGLEKTVKYFVGEGN